METRKKPGRPPVSEQMVTIACTIPPQTAKRFREEATARGVGVSQIAREYIALGMAEVAAYRAEASKG